MKIGKELAELTAGLDALYRATQNSDGFLNKEGLIPVAMAEVVPLPLVSYDDAREKLHALAARLPAEAESALRADYVAEMIDSLLALIDTFDGTPISFADRVARQIRVPQTLVPDAELEGYRATIREKLDELGYSGGTLAEDFERYEAQARVPTAQVLAVLNELIAEARTRVTATMYPYDHEGMTPEGVTAVPFSAYCDYPTRKVLLNLDFPYTRFSLKHLATHEVFPGHLVHMNIRENMVEAESMPLDGAQVVTSSASSAIFEGIADNGMEFLDWVNGPEDELGVALQRLRSAMRCNAAWMMHALGMSLDEIVPIMADKALQDPITARSRLAFLSHNLRAPFVYAYYGGDMAVNAVWKLVRPEQRKAFWEYLYNNMHTPSTLAKHWHAFSN